MNVAKPMGGVLWSVLLHIAVISGAQSHAAALDDSLLSGNGPSVLQKQSPGGQRQVLLLWGLEARAMLSKKSSNRDNKLKQDRASEAN